MFLVWIRSERVVGDIVQEQGIQASPVHDNDRLAWRHLRLTDRQWVSCRRSNSLLLVHVHVLWPRWVFAGHQEDCANDKIH